MQSALALLRSVTPRVLSPLAASALIACAALSACADNERSVFIRGVAPLVRSGDSCSADAGTDQFLLRGQVDIGLTGHYSLPLVIGNQMLTRSDRLKLNSEGTGVFIQRAEVRVTGADGTQIGAFSTPTSAVIDPSNDGSSPGLGIALVDVFDDTIYRALEGVLPGSRNDYVARVTVFGETQGGHSVSSNEYLYPFTVCQGCLVAFPPADTTTGQINCATFVEPAPCAIGENEATACGLCRGRPVCTPPN